MRYSYISLTELKAKALGKLEMEGTRTHYLFLSLLSSLQHVPCLVRTFASIVEYI